MYKCLSVQRVHGARPVNSNSLAFLVTGNLHSSFFPSFLLICSSDALLGLCVAVLLLFMILNSHQMPPNFLVMSLMPFSFS